MGVCGKIENVIKLYDHLTDADLLPDNVNFLESIKYKMGNGNKILESLLKLEEKGIPFIVIKGFRLNEEDFSKFERCIITIPEDISIEEISKLITDISVKCMEDHLYELAIL
jgi:hypothetical protein